MAEVSVKQAARTFAVLANPGHLSLLLTLTSDLIIDATAIGRE